MENHQDDFKGQFAQCLEFVLRAQKLERCKNYFYTKIKNIFVNMNYDELEEWQEGHLACLCLAMIVELNGKKPKTLQTYFKEQFKILYPYPENSFQMKKLKNGFYATNIYEFHSDWDTDVLLEKLGLEFKIDQDE